VLVSEALGRSRFFFCESPKHCQNINLSVGCLFYTDLISAPFVLKRLDTRMFLHVLDRVSK
jgi:hypothetical protein